MGGSRTMALLLVFALGAAWLPLGADPASAQVRVRRPAEPEAIDDATKAAIIDSVSAALEAVYVFPDVASRMEEAIRHNLRTRAYRDIETYEEFAGRLTEDLQGISNDKHLHVDYFPDPGTESANRDSLADEEQRRRLEQLRKSNYGFAKLENLAGNVGYLDLRSFTNARWAGETAVAAMAFLAGSDAVIIDLRQNGGGSPSMIQLISSYFFDEPVHLNSFYIRDEDKTQQFWSHAHVEGERMTDVDLYVLTSGMTFSAAEEFTYNMKNLERATIVGETTGGGAHPVRFVGFPDLRVSMSLPFGRAVNPISGTNWEGTGVEPDIEVPQAEALEVAHLEALKGLKEKAEDEEDRRALTWGITLMEARLNPVEVDAEKAEKYAGGYGPRNIIFEDGQLYYHRQDRPKLRMIPASETLFTFAEYDFFMLEVETDAGGNPTALVGHYSNGRTDRNPRDD
jgi:hypothetical protein